MEKKNKYGDVPDWIFEKVTRVVASNVEEGRLEEYKKHIAEWFMEMYEKDSDVLKEMAKSDDLLKMIQRELRLSRLLD